MAEHWHYPAPDDYLLTPAQVAAWLAVSKRTLWRMVKRGTIPAPLRYNRKLVRWKASEVLHYIEGLS